MTGTARAHRISEGLATVNTRITAACRAAGRDPATVGLVVVTKTHPPSDIRVLHELGVRDIGENRVQEAQTKAAELTDLPDLRWHQIGQVQTNKANAVARWAHVVHAVDRARLVRALARAAAGADRELSCLVQVSLDGDLARGGAAITQVPELADAIAAAPGLRLGGVMAVAPLGADPVQAFTLLAEVADRVRQRHPDATTISAGMSGDLEAAVAAGATLLRVGTAILGSRPPLQ